MIKKNDEQYMLIIRNEDNWKRYEIEYKKKSEIKLIRLKNI